MLGDAAQAVPEGCTATASSTGMLHSQFLRDALPQGQLQGTIPPGWKALRPGQHWPGGHSSLGTELSWGITTVTPVGSAMATAQAPVSGVSKELAAKITICPLLSFCELFSGEL